MEHRVAVIGLGYVGLPLAVEFSKKFPTFGFDISEKRIKELKSGKDSTLEIEKEILLGSKIFLTAKKQDIHACNTFIITVPTPIDHHKNPDLRPLISATELVASILKKGDFVIYESTVYPGCTEEDCVPILEKLSGLKLNKDFYCGYSPERVNPGDKDRTIPKITKITSGSNDYAAEVVDKLYSQIIIAGTYRVSSIKVAEAAKVIENTQRDINIAYVNELAMIFNRMGIDTLEILKAASTKWNFLNFRPGLVGGHCIGVDPFYLTHKAESFDIHPQMILSGRRINDNMGVYIAGQVIKKMLKNGISVSGSKVLVMGLTFKENCPDTRNSKVKDIIHELREFNCQVSICDPWVSDEQMESDFPYLEKVPFQNIKNKKFDAVVFAVAHKEFYEINTQLLKSKAGIVYDVKGIFPIHMSDGRL